MTNESSKKSDVKSKEVLDSQATNKKIAERLEKYNKKYHKEDSKNDLDK